MEQTIYLQPAQKIEEKPEPPLTRSMKRQFPLFGVSSLLYSAFYAFCLYKNASGITYPFFVIGTLCYFFFSMQKLGVPYKKDSIFYIVSVVLLGISNCMTTSPQILFMNKCGIFLLSFTLMLHTVYNDKAWNLPKYFSAIFQTMGVCFWCLFRPFSDMISYFDAQKQEKSEKKSWFLPIFFGLVIALPLLFLITVLLASADAVFGNMLLLLTNSFDVWTITEIFFLVTVVFFCSYAILAALCRKDMEEEIRERKRFDSITAIVTTSLLCVLYVFFSVIQILYLFIGKMELPKYYTYAQYAREGFFQLLVVCIINLLIVLTCLYLFRESNVLKTILTIICGCTFIMILSSALRMILYIDRYSLTFLRLFVLWALAVIFLLMAGVTVYIFCRQFPLFFYGLSIVTVFYIALSFSHPDYLVARYNLVKPCEDHCLPAIYSDGPCDTDYLSRLSTDAAPAILNPETNPYLTSVKDMLEKTEEMIKGDHDHNQDYLDAYWMRDFYCKMEDDTFGMGIRDFNFSLYKAKKYIK